jgi:Cyclic nucleotide-binding domain
VVALAAETILERPVFSVDGGFHPCRFGVLTAIALLRFHSQGPVDALYAMVTVEIALGRPGGREVFLDIVEPGDAFGEIALLDRRRRTATASV